MEMTMENHLLLERVESQLRALPPEKLAVVAEFVDFVSTRNPRSEADFAMRLSEDAFGRLWNTPEEDEAWADL